MQYFRRGGGLPGLPGLSGFPDIFAIPRADKVNSPPEVAKLVSSLELAKTCKDYLRKRQETEALACFVRACCESIMCLDTLSESIEQIAVALEKAENKYSNEHQSSGRRRAMLPIHKAARAVLMGFKMLPLEDRTVHMMMHSSVAPNTPEANLLGMLFSLREPDVRWLINWGCFKMAYTLVLDFRLRLNSDREQLMYSAYATQCYEHMHSIKDTHPATLQAGAQLYLLKQNDLDPKLNLEEFELSQRPSEIMGMLEGYLTALQGGDAASAVLHILQGMYMMLQETHGQPSLNEQEELQAAADKVMELIVQLRDEWRVWEPVAEKLLTSMLYLGYSFPLAQALNNHPLARFITAEHKRQQQLLIETDKALKDAHRDGDDSQDSDSDMIGDLKGSPRDVEALAERCARCNKYIAQKMDKVMCQHCHAAFYCSAYCQKKDAQGHKVACKRARLKSKIAAKGSAK